jgi:hypothetical protein
MFCTSCGADLGTASKFCPACGSGSDHLVRRFGEARFTTKRDTRGLEIVIGAALVFSVIGTLSLMSVLDPSDSFQASSSAESWENLTDLSGLVGLVAGVWWLIWQRRTLIDARDLFAATAPKRSPNWGTFSWIVPIANFWVPQLALRDAMLASRPAGASDAEVQRLRTVHSWWWLTFIGGSIVAGLISTVAVRDEDLSLLRIGLLLSAAAQVSAGVFAIQLLRGISGWQNRRGRELLELARAGATDS